MQHTGCCHTTLEWIKCLLHCFMPFLNFKKKNNSSDGTCNNFEFCPQILQLMQNERKVRQLSSHLHLWNASIDSSITFIKLALICFFQLWLKLSMQQLIIHQCCFASLQEKPTCWKWCCISAGICIALFILSHWLFHYADLYAYQRAGLSVCQM